MSGLYTAAAAACGCCIAVSLLSRFVTDGGMQKLLGMVMGAFIVCAMLVPAVRAVRDIAADGQTAAVPKGEISTTDEAFNREILRQTKQNLEIALRDVLTQNGFPPRRAEVLLALAEENRVIIAKITLTFDAAYAGAEERVADITERHFTVRPHIVWE